MSSDKKANDRDDVATGVNILQTAQREKKKEYEVFYNLVNRCTKVGDGAEMQT